MLSCCCGTQLLLMRSWSCCWVLQLAVCWAMFSFICFQKHGLTLTNVCIWCKWCGNVLSLLNVDKLSKCLYVLRFLSMWTACLALDLNILSGLKAMADVTQILLPLPQSHLLTPICLQLNEVWMYKKLGSGWPSLQISFVRNFIHILLLCTDEICSHMALCSW